MPRWRMEPRITGVRALVREDLVRLEEPRYVHPVKRLRQSHHQLALLEAQGYSTGEISKLTGYSETRIQTLRHDPAFMMIVEEKAKVIHDAVMKNAIGLMERKSLIMAATDRMILDHIDELDAKGELMPLKTALAISADMADRVGFSKHSSTTSYDGDFAKRMENLISRGKVVETPKVVEPLDVIDEDGRARPIEELRPPQAVGAGPPKRSGSESPSPGVPLRLLQGGKMRR